MMPAAESFAMPAVGIPILSLLIALPVVCAVLLLFLQGEVSLRRCALAAASLELLVSVGALLKFDRGAAQMQFVERYPWMPSLHVEYHVGIDGISVLFIPLTAFLIVMVMLSSWKSVRSKLKAFLVALLVVESITMGIFCALDMVLFFVFWELLLVPTYFLISLWGLGPERRRAAFMYFIYMAVGSAPMLLGIILLGINHAHHAPATAEGPFYSFDYLRLLATPVPAGLQGVIFFLLFLAFIVKSPIVPFHTWLPGALVEGPIGMGILLIGIKIGPYGILRFVLPLLPDAAAEFSWMIMALGVIGTLYGALVALVQTNLRRLLAYVSVSHVGLVTVGLASRSTQGLQGALLQAVNMGFTSTGLLFLAGCLHSRLGSSELGEYGGLARRAPILAGFFLLLGLAGAGLPGTCGFIGEHLILLGAFQASHYAAALVLVGAIVGAAYLFGYFERAFLGPVTRPLVAAMEDLRPREIAVAAALAVMVLWGGLYPAPFVDATSASIGALIHRINPAGANAAPPPPKSPLAGVAGKGNPGARRTRYTAVTMDITHEIALRLGSLPADKQQEVLDFVEFLRARANITADDNAQPFRGMPVTYVDPTAPVAAEDWEAAR